MDPDRDFRPFFLFLTIVFIVVFIGLFTPFRDQLSFHIDDIKSRLFYRLNAPDQAVFVPREASAGSVNSFHHPIHDN